MVTFPYWDKGHLNTGFWHGYIESWETGILDCAIAMLGYRIQEYWVVKLQYWNKGNSHTGMWHCHIGRRDTRILDMTLPYNDKEHRNTGLWHYHIGTEDTGILDCDIAILRQRILKYWIVTLLYWDKGHWNTGF